MTADVEGDTLHVRWSSSSTENEVVLAVRWSADDGRTWQALAMMLQEDEAYAPLEMFTSGAGAGAGARLRWVPYYPERCCDEVDVPVRPPHAVILWPRTDGTAESGELVRLWGTATASDGRVLPEDAPALGAGQPASGGWLGSVGGTAQLGGGNTAPR